MMKSLCTGAIALAALLWTTSMCEASTAQPDLDVQQSLRVAAAVPTSATTDVQLAGWGHHYHRHHYFRPRLLPRAHYHYYAPRYYAPRYYAPRYYSYPYRTYYYPGVGYGGVSVQIGF